MTQAISGVTTIRNAVNPPNPLDLAIHTAGRKLLALQMTRLGTCVPTKGDAQAVVRDLLDIATIVDDAVLAIGRECRDFFGSAVDLGDFTDQLRDAFEGFATHSICAAMEDREDDDGSDYRYDERANAA